LGSLLLCGAVLACLVIASAPVLRKAAEGASGVTSYGATQDTTAPDSYYIILIAAIIAVPVGLTLGPWLIASNVKRQIPKIILRAASMAFLFAPAIRIVTKAVGDARLVLVPFWWAVGEAGLDEKSVANMLWVSLLVCWVLFSAIAVVVARAQVSGTSMTVLALSVPGLVLLSLLPCLFVPAFSPLVWAGEATMGWSLYLLLVTRRVVMSSSYRLWALRAWLLLCAGAGALITLVASVAIGEWASHVT